MKFEELVEGKILFSIEKGPVTLLQTIKYAGASGDFNPIHIITENAKEAGFDAPIIPGMMIMGIIGEMVADIFDVRTIRKYSLNFKLPFKVGDKLNATGRITNKYENEEGCFALCKLEITDQNDVLKITGRCLICFQKNTSEVFENP